MRAGIEYDPNRPIDTLEEARSFFVAMGCNGFHMSRENPDRYQEFQHLAVSEALQDEWRLQEFEATCDLLATVPLGDRHHLFSYLIDLSDWSRAALEALLSAAATLVEELPGEQLVVVAETLLDRNALEARTGLVLRAYDQGYPDLARQLLDVTGRSLDRAEPDPNLRGPFGDLIFTEERIDSARLRMSETAALIATAAVAA